MSNSRTTDRGGRYAAEAAALAASLGVAEADIEELRAWLARSGYDLGRAEFFQPVAQDWPTAAERVAGVTLWAPPETLWAPQETLWAPPETLWAPPETPGRKQARLGEKLAAGLRRLERAEALDRTDREPVQTLTVDVETYSGEDIGTSGHYRYVEAEDFRVLLIAWSVNGGPVEQADIEHGEELPTRIRRALTDRAVVKRAFNAAFEHAVLERWLGEPLPWEQWSCTMHLAARCGYPQSLDACGAALGIARPKMREGAALIRRFCTKAGRERRYKEDEAEAWETFKAYNVRDVEAELDIEERLTGLVRVTGTERRVELADWAINDRGAAVDLRLARQASAMFAAEKERMKEELRELTGLKNPNSAAQLRAWLTQETGRPVESVGKAVIGDAVKGHERAEAVAAIRAELGKTSCAKYDAVLATACRDGRVHGLTQYYGAARTGRWAGRLVQTQNLPQNHLPDLDYARQLVLAGDRETLAFDFGVVTPVLSELVRTVFVAPPGRVLRVADFSAIEARVIAWLAGEQWVLDVFRSHGKIYEATAARMYHVPVESIGKHDPRRQKGKIAVLALGYGGGVNALRAMGGERMGLCEGEMKQIVYDWRRANPGIVRLWTTVEDTFRRAIVYGGPAEMQRGIVMERRGDGVAVRLPSGRELYYPAARIREDGRCAYMGTEQTTRRWAELETYGGKLTENLVQAIARDCLAVTLLRLERAGYPVDFHVHDEAICECDAEHGSS